MIQVLSLVVCFSLAGVAKPAKANLEFESRHFTLSPEVVETPDGSLRLAHSLLVSNETGATDFHQGEGLSAKVWAKKIIPLESNNVAEAELFFFGGAKEVVVNGEKLAAPEKLISTGWSRVKVPTNLLKKGNNEVLFSGGGHLLVEPTRPGLSFKSTDGGKTWSQDSLTGAGDVQGEYVVRLRLERYPTTGWAMSPVIDLGGANPIPAIPALHKIYWGSVGKQVKGTKITTQIRTGPTPTFDPKTWTGWQDGGQVYAHPTDLAKNRWLQVKFLLSTTDPQTSPSLPAKFSIGVEIEPGMQPYQSYKLVSKQPEIRITSIPFSYQSKSGRLEHLRKRYKLDEVIAPGKTEFEQLQLLRYWVRNQWHTAWGSHPAAWMPQWDAIEILESRDQPECLTMCTHYAAVFVQCCQALGWNARHCILDHHCTAEVYIQEFNKWVMMDAGNSAQRSDVGLNFERSGVPMSARELHLAYRDKKLDGIEVRFTSKKLSDQIQSMCRPAPKAVKEPRPDLIPLEELRKFPVCQIENYRRYAFPARNTFITSAMPGELYQGWSEYFYDGYCWVGDSPDGPKNSPEYTRLITADRPQEADWHLNWVRPYLSQTHTEGQLKVDLATHTPNLQKFESMHNGAWKTSPASFIWNLVPGVNTLTVRSVNQWGKTGTPAVVVVEWTK